MTETATTLEDAAVVAELISAANDIEGVPNSERAQLLQRAASIISDYRVELDALIVPAKEDGPDDVVHELNELARHIDQAATDEVVSAMLNAAEIIAERRTILRAKST